MILLEVLDFLYGLSIFFSDSKDDLSLFIDFFLERLILLLDHNIIFLFFAFLLF